MDESRDPILITREATHGSFKTTAQISQILKRTVRHYRPDLPGDQMEALEMICMKFARILSGDPNERDHWKDISGYAKLGEEGCQ